MCVILRARDATSGSKSEIKSGQGWHARPTLRVSRSNFSTPRMERETSLRGSLCKRYSLSLSFSPSWNNSRIPRGHRPRVLRSSGLVRERGERYVVQISYRRSGVSRPRFWGFWVAEFLENWSRRLNRLSFASFYRHRRAIVRVDIGFALRLKFSSYDICWNKYLSSESLRNFSLHPAISFTY